MSDTRQRLIDGAVQTVRDHGFGGASARAIAATAGVNQALVFYHFGSVNELLRAACVTATEERVQTFLHRLDEVTDLRALLSVGRELHTEERALGHVTLMAQMLAGAQSDPNLAEWTAFALNLWIEPVERTMRRLLADSPVADVIDIPGLTRAVCAGFVGLELFEGVDPAGAESALDALDRLGALVEVVEDMGPVARRALRAKLRRSERKKGEPPRPG
ncbi:TetR/AcrR family transcriptional regulator [Actinokineospora enzanensis]|uniref:TetR/AcrR family transcriptional regulator n=1 Tax=Actinokineospora enzanensis TaxID=155975 RepID=UPI0003721C1D|nr:TetR/AcrR family transcriptional regulator [Actinokineospora enzanensis]